MFRVDPMIRRNTGWLHSGRFSRGGESLDYVTRMDKYLLWVRYRGNPSLISTWQSLILHRHYLFEAVKWSASCPWCCSQIYEFYVYKRSLRCRHCVILTSRWGRQMMVTQELRSEIRKGDLTNVSQNLQGGFREVFRAMLAMELTGLSPRRFSSPRKMDQAWTHSMKRSRRR